MHGFYINLRHRTDRRDYMQRQLVARGLAAERFEALTPAGLPDGVQQRGAAFLSPNELACCSQSHRAIWEQIVARGLPAALVLEDDCVLAPDIAVLLADPGLLDPNVGLLQLETHPSAAILGRAATTTVPGVTRHRMLSSSLGACAYVITAEVARDCLARPELDQVETGVFLFGRDGPNLYRHGVFQIYPAMATPLDALLPPEVGPQRSDLNGVRFKVPAGARPRASRLQRNLSHVRRAMRAFGPLALIGARHYRIPFAGSAELVRDLL